MKRGSVTFYRKTVIFRIGMRIENKKEAKILDIANSMSNLELFEYK